MADLEMCRGCANLYTGDGSCMLGTTQAEREQKAAAGRCDRAAQAYNESDHTPRATGSMVLNAVTGDWEFCRNQ